MHSEATAIQQYIDELPEDRKYRVEMVRQVILKNLPAGYEEVTNWGMITYQVPLETYSDTYNKKALMYAALASQKNHCPVLLPPCRCRSARMPEPAKMETSPAGQGDRPASVFHGTIRAHGPERSLSA